MNSTPGEFERSLRLAFATAVGSTADGLLLDVDGIRLHFALRRENPGRIGALQLAALRVEVSVLAGDAKAAARLLAQVDRATLRGGG
jgi:hypothetical protein